MATNLALKRAKKVARRKEVTAQRRKFEVVESSLSARIRRAADTPVRSCLLHGEAEGGMVNVIIARGVSPSRVSTAFFLVDLYCLGIKDVVFHEFSAEEFAISSMAMSEEAPLTPIDPTYARKLLRDAAAWATAIGFKPHRDFIAVEQIFGDVDADACGETFTFGSEGKPFYIAGPTETRAQIRKRLSHLRDRLGEDGFDYIIGI